MGRPEDKNAGASERMHLARVIAKKKPADVPKNSPGRVIQTPEELIHELEIHGP